MNTVVDPLTFVIEKARFDEFNPAWRDELSSTNGRPMAHLANVALPLRVAPEWHRALALDEFRLEIVLRRAAPWDGDFLTYPRQWEPHDTLKATEWLNQHNLNVDDALVHKAVLMVAREHAFHPVRDYLHRLNWDGKKRLDNWLTTYLGVKKGDYAQAVGSRFLISAVARVIRPGCKVDTVLNAERQARGGEVLCARDVGGTMVHGPVARPIEQGCLHAATGCMAS